MLDESEATPNREYDQHKHQDETAAASGATSLTGLVMINMALRH
jgi:hypothetical protein